MADCLQKIECLKVVPCKVCESDAYLFDVVDFSKFCNNEDYYSWGLSGIPVYYRKCEHCGLVFTNSFDELDKKMFSELVYNDDYVKFDPDYVENRPRQNAAFLDEFLSSIKEAVKGLDYGSGNGLTAAILAGKGWDFQACDPISNPVQPSVSFKDFNVISAFEVFEHVPFPISGMENMLRYAGKDCLLIVSTLATDGQVSSSRLDWWYAGPRNGHVTLHSKKSLRLLFEKYGFSYYSPNNSLHIGVRGVPPDPRFVEVVQATAQLFTWKKVKRWFGRRFNKK